MPEVHILKGAVVLPRRLRSTPGKNKSKSTNATNNAAPKAAATGHVQIPNTTQQRKAVLGPDVLSFFFSLRSRKDGGGGKHTLAELTPDTPPSYRSRTILLLLLLFVFVSLAHMHSALTIRIYTNLRLRFQLSSSMNKMS